MKRVFVVGQKVGKLTIVDAYPDMPKRHNRKVVVDCDCGRRGALVWVTVLYRKNPHCGCDSYKNRCIRKLHKEGRGVLYRQWIELRQTGELEPIWHDDYGKVLEFTQGKQDVYLVRLDKNKPFGASNCRVRLFGETRAALIEINGEFKSLQEWSVFLGVSRQRAHQLLKRGRLVFRVLQKKGQSK